MKQKSSFKQGWQAAKGAGRALGTKKIKPDPGTFYRVITGEDAFNDIVKSGKVRTNAGNKPTVSSKGVSLAHRPTVAPSFAKGKIALEYAANNPKHYVVATKDPSIKPSTMGRHGKGTTHFPTGADGKPLKEMSSASVDVYRHTGEGKYKLAYAKGKKVVSPKEALLAMKTPKSFKAGWNNTKAIGGKGLGGAFAVTSALDILPAMREGRTKDVITNTAWTAQGAASSNKAVGSYAAKKLGARAVPVAGSALLAWEGGQMIGEALNTYTPVQKMLAKGLDRVTGLDARNKRSLAPTKMKARKKP